MDIDFDCKMNVWLFFLPLFMHSAVLGMIQSEGLLESLQIILKFIKGQAGRTAVKGQVPMMIYHKSSQAPNKQDKSWDFKI